MNVPSISIIIPVYNVELYLRQCLDSLVGQTFQDIEIICVDDGSTDGGLAILQEYAARDERIRVMSQPNRGVSVARNEGMKLACAPYIMFCDPDDWCELNMCEILYHALEGVKEANMAMCGTQPEYDYEVSQKRVLGDENWFKIRYSGLTELTGEMLLHNFSAAVCSKLYRRSFLLEHNIQFPEIVICEDFYFFNVYLAHSTHIVFVQDKLYHYRQRQGSISFEVLNNKPFVSIDRLRACMLLWDYYKKHGVLEKWDGYIAKRWLQCLKICLDNERTKKARRLIVHIVKEFIKDNDKNTHALSDANRSEIIRLMNQASSNPAIRAMKYRLKKQLINLMPAAAWRRRLRRRYL